MVDLHILSHYHINFLSQFQHIKTTDKSIRIQYKSRFYNAYWSFLMICVETGMDPMVCSMVCTMAKNCAWFDRSKNAILSDYISVKYWQWLIWRDFACFGVDFGCVNHEKSNVFQIFPSFFGRDIALLFGSFILSVIAGFLRRNRWIALPKAWLW